MANSRKSLNMKKVDQLCKKLEKINQPFTRPKTLNLMDKKLIEMDDLKLTDLGYYDVDYNQSLYGLMF